MKIGIETRKKICYNHICKEAKSLVSTYKPLNRGTFPTEAHRTAIHKWAFFFATNSL